MIKKPYPIFKILLVPVSLVTSKAKDIGHFLFIQQKSFCLVYVYSTYTQYKFKRI